MEDLAVPAFDYVTVCLLGHLECLRCGDEKVNTWHLMTKLAKTMCNRLNWDESSIDTSLDVYETTSKFKVSANS